MSRVTVGDRSERLLALELIPDAKNPRVRCRCDCGVEITVQRGSFKSGRSKSCGCLKAQRTSRMARTHGQSKTAAYRVWRNMLQRCRNPDNKAYANYGARGIDVLWPTFEAFYDEMGQPPAGTWIERRDNNRSYGPGNCIWVTPQQNQMNKRTSRTWTIDGVSYAKAADAAVALQVDPSVIVRGCLGYSRNGKRYPPRAGWRSEKTHP